MDCQFSITTGSASLLPSNQRLIRGAQEALKSAMCTNPPSDGGAALVTVKTLLDELALRNDDDFFAGYCSEGTKLLQAGSTLLKERAKHQGSAPALPFGLERSHDNGISAIARIDKMQTILADLVSKLAPWESADGQVTHFLAQVVDWENQLYSTRARRGSAQENGEQISRDAFTVESVERYLGKRFPDRLIPHVTALRKLTGGFSKSTLMFDVEYPNASRTTLVIRAEQPTSLVLLEGATIRNEYYVLRLAHAAGLPVATPLWLENDSKHFGVEFLVSAKAEGKIVGTAVGLTEGFSDSLLTDLVRKLVQIHDTPIDADDSNVRSSHLGRWLGFRTLTESNRQNVAHWREIITSMGLPASPIVTRALDWLEKHIPDSVEAPSLVHRDFGAHNILVENDCVSCILDWESATIGDPAEDLAWMTNCMKGQVDRQRILEKYAEFSGRAVPIERIQFFDVLTSLKYAVTCLQALSLFDKLPTSPANLCHLGLMYMYHGTADLNRCIEIAASAQSGE